MLGGDDVGDGVFAERRPFLAIVVLVDLVAWAGSLAPPAPFDNSRAAWRMVPVLRRLPRP